METTTVNHPLEHHRPSLVVFESDRGHAVSVDNNEEQEKELTANHDVDSAPLLQLQHDNDDCENGDASRKREHKMQTLLYGHQEHGQRRPTRSSTPIIVPRFTFVLLLAAVMIVSFVTGLLTTRRSQKGLFVFPNFKQEHSNSASSWGDQLRLQVALWSIDQMMLQQDGVDANNTSKGNNNNRDDTSTTDSSFLVDIGQFHDLIQVGLDTMGMNGVFGGDLFEPSKFASSLEEAAKIKGLTTSQFHVELGRGHEATTTVLYGGSIPAWIDKSNNNDDDTILDLAPKRCLNNVGCLIWLRHYSGVIAANKLVRDGRIRVLGAPAEADTGTGIETTQKEEDDDVTIFIDSAQAFMKQLQRLERKGIHDATTTDAEHGFLWTYTSLIRLGEEGVASTITSFPLQLADELCGEYLEKDEVLEISQLNLGWVCRHGLGHAVYYSLANDEISKETRTTASRRWTTRTTRTAKENGKRAHR